MIKNYIRVALRNLTRYKFFSFINIFGLAISMAICLAIIMLVADQMSYDQHNSKKNRIYQVNTTPIKIDGKEDGFNKTSTSPMMLKTALLEEYKGVEKSFRVLRGFGNNWLTLDQGDINIPIGGYYADPEILDIMEYELEYGDTKTALVEPYSVVLTKEAAKKLFSQENPMGEMIKVGSLGEYKVTGILKETRNKTHIAFEALASISSVTNQDGGATYKDVIINWNHTWDGWVYIQLEEGVDSKEIKKNLANITAKHYPKKSDTVFEFDLTAINAITPGEMINNPIGPSLPFLFIYFMGGLAAIIMITACFNYTNLSIARSLTRAKEIGIRKVSGAGRWSIFTQFITESVVISLFALVLAIGILTFIGPLMFEFKIAKALKWDLRADMTVYLAFLGFSIFIGVLAGLFPALVLSRFKPVNVLKNLNNMKLFSRIGIRKALLVGQFALSMIFILSVTLVYNQLDLFVTADHGFTMENKINIRLNETSAELLKTELLKQSNIKSVSASSHIPSAGTQFGLDYRKSLDQEDIDFSYYNVDEDYIASMEIPLIAGTNFPETSLENKKNYILINEQGVKDLGYKTPMDAIGEQLITSDSSKVEIAGVVKDYNHQMMMEKIEALALVYNPDGFSILQVEYTGDQKEAIKTLRSAWTKVNPTLKLDYRMFEEEVRMMYDLIFGDLTRFVGVITFLAIFISCLGLLGMATYTTETRMKEIAIRKVLGATEKSLVYQLSKGFVSLILISIIIAIPLAYLLNNLWLQEMAYRVEMNVGVVLFGVFVLMILGLITVGSQTLRAAYVNPVDKLKNE